MIDLKVTLYEILKKLENSGGAEDINWYNVSILDFDKNLVSILRIPSDVVTFGELVEETDLDINYGLGIWASEGDSITFNNTLLDGFSFNGLQIHLTATTTIDNIDLTKPLCYRQQSED